MLLLPLLLITVVSAIPHPSDSHIRQAPDRLQPRLYGHEPDRPRGIRRVDRKRSAGSSTHQARLMTESVLESPAESVMGSSEEGALFPAGRGKASWTTAASEPGALSVKSALTPLQFGKLPPTSTAPDGSSALIATYPADTVDYSSSTGHGYSFYSPATANSLNITSATELTFAYSVYFESGFAFNKGGKLPGLYGGTSLAAAKSCSGGRQDDREDCWSARLMWRTNGMGEVYNYFPKTAVQPAGYCSTAPMSLCNADYGDSIGRGAFTFPTGQWTALATRIKMNDPGVSNGEEELFVNGQSVIKLSGIQVAVNPGTKFYGIMAQTFFGGNDMSWASPKNQSAWFKDWSIAILA